MVNYLMYTYANAALGTLPTSSKLMIIVPEFKS